MARSTIPAPPQPQPPQAGAGERSISAQERLIVALDVPAVDEALRIVDALEGLVSFYKVGLELLMSGGMGDLLARLAGRYNLFVDLKLPSDIPETVRRTTSLAARLGVNLLTLSHSAGDGTIRDAVAGRGDKRNPKLLFVPFLSSLDSRDFARATGQDASQFEAFLQDRCAKALEAGVDGFIISGQQIGLLRRLHPRALLVSPGIRPAGAATDDHKRSCTPAEAVRLGADYIVVGRPIRDAANRRDAAARIVDEIAKG